MKTFNVSDYDLTKLETKLGLRKWKGDGKDVFLWNDPVVITHNNHWIHNKVPRLYKGVSAYAIIDNELCYMGEDDGTFYAISKVVDLKELKELKNVFTKFYNKTIGLNIANTDKAKQYFKDNLDELNKMFNGVIELTPRDKEINENVIVKFKVGNATRELHYYWLKDEIDLIEELLDIFNMYEYISNLIEIKEVLNQIGKKDLAKKAEEIIEII